MYWGNQENSWKRTQTLAVFQTRKNFVGLEHFKYLKDCKSKYLNTLCRASDIIVGKFQRTNTMQIGQW